MRIRKNNLMDNRSSPDSESVDGIEDICLGQVEDDVAVKVPDLKNALFVTPVIF